MGNCLISSINNEIKGDKINEIKGDKINEIKEDKIEIKGDKIEIKGDKIEIKGDKINEILLNQKLTKDFSFEGQIINVFIPSDGVYDGDTIRGIFYSSLNDLPIQWKIRMNGYDSPEMKPLKSKENRELEIELAHKAKDALIGLIGNKIVQMHCDKFDKYGRILATIYVEELNVNQWMIDNGHGYPYFGGTKKE